jgi:hypothetical protein
MSGSNVITLFLTVAAVVLPPLVPVGANTVDIVHDDYGAYGAATFWAAGHSGNVAMAGVYQLDKTGGTGAGNLWASGWVPGFCMELEEPPPSLTHTYAVTMPDNVYSNYLGQTLGTTKANYLRELWGRFYDGAWASGGPYSAAQNAAAESFAAAVWEIIYEDLPASPADWDVTTDGTTGKGGFFATNLDAMTANKWLHELTGVGPKADLLAFAGQGQDYLVAVPEQATVLLLGLGGAAALLRRTRGGARQVNSV